MKVSACMILKDGEDFLREVVLSFIDHVDEFIAVVDDESSDGTMDILKEFSPRIIRGRYKGNKKAQNQAFLDVAKGDWIFRPDDDEVFSDVFMEWFRYIIKRSPDTLEIGVRHRHFYRDFIHTIHGPMYDNHHERIYRRIPGLRYVNHQCVGTDDGERLYALAKRKGRLLNPHPDEMVVFHYGLCKSAAHIRGKLKYYMLRDNPNCPDEKAAEEYVEKHYYFSDDFNVPRYGEGGLYCCGEVNGRRDEVKRYRGEHPEIMRKHPLYATLYSRAVEINEYMENHWVLHNHLAEGRHQRRLAATAKLCKGNTLDVGCANGLPTECMSRANPDAVFSGVEASDWGYKEATKDYPLRRFYKNYAENLSMMDDSFDTVTVGELLEHVLDPEAVVKEALRVASKQAVFSTPAKEVGDPDHKRVMKPDEVEKLLANCGVKKIDFHGIDKAGYPAQGNNVNVGIYVAHLQE